MLSFSSTSHQITPQLLTQDMQWGCILRQQMFRRCKGCNRNLFSAVLETSSRDLHLWGIFPLWKQKCLSTAAQCSLPEETVGRIKSYRSKIFQCPAMQSCSGQYLELENWEDSAFSCLHFPYTQVPTAALPDGATQLPGWQTLPICVYTHDAFSVRIQTELPIPLLQSNCTIEEDVRELRVSTKSSNNINRH